MTRLCPTHSMIKHREIAFRCILDAVVTCFRFYEWKKLLRLRASRTGPRLSGSVHHSFHTHDLNKA